MYYCYSQKSDNKENVKITYVGQFAAFLQLILLTNTDTAKKNYISSRSRNYTNTIYLYRTEREICTLTYYYCY